jgi:hypothetical protein
MGYSMNGSFSNADVDASEDVVTIRCRDMEELFLSFVVGTANLGAFTVEYRVAAEGGWFTVASAAGDYTSPTGVILGASGDLTTAASGATVHWLNLSVKAVHDVRIKAAGTSSTIAGHWGAN